MTRARGWGIPVPGDPGQVIYVWYDALANYLAGLGYAAPPGADYRRWWVEGDRRLHVIGKGILRFHAVYWPAILLSAGLPVPTDIVVHDYLTVEGRKLGKSLVNAIDAALSTGRHRRPPWCLVRSVPSFDTDFPSSGWSRGHAKLGQWLRTWPAASRPSSRGGAASCPRAAAAPSRTRAPAAPAYSGCRDRRRCDRPLRHPPGERVCLAVVV